MLRIAFWDTAPRRVLLSPERLRNTHLNICICHAGLNEDYMRIALYYEGIEDWGNAGRYYGICNEHAKAMKLFLRYS